MAVFNKTNYPPSSATSAAVRAALGIMGSTTPEAGLAHVITTGGTAIIVAEGPNSGGYVINPNPAAAQGLGLPENAYINMTGPPGSTDAAASGTTSILFPGDRFDLPPLDDGVSVYVNAASSGHKLTVVVYP